MLAVRKLPHPHGTVHQVRTSELGSHMAWLVIHYLVKESFLLGYVKVNAQLRIPCG